MNRQLGYFELTTLCLLTAALTLNVGVVRAGGNRIVASATGGYQVTFGGEERTVSFTAQMDSSNSSRGQAELFNHVTGTRLHFDIDCLNVVGNVATMSGSITRSDSTVFVAGLPFWLQVADNGEGPNKPRDLASPLFVIFGPGVPCTSPLVPASIPIEGGNITVH